MTGHESDIDIRRDDGTLDVSLNWIARNGEVHFTLEVNSMYGLAKTIVDLTPDKAAEIGEAFREAARRAGTAEVPLSAVPAGRIPQGRYHPDHSRVDRNPRRTAQDVGHVLGERD